MFTKLHNFLIRYPWHVGNNMSWIYLESSKKKTILQYSNHPHTMLNYQKKGLFCLIYIMFIDASLMTPLNGNAFENDKITFAVIYGEC